MERLYRKVDVLLFNPPYVPTSSEEALHAQAKDVNGEENTDEISSAWAGGIDGMEITNKFLGDVEVRDFSASDVVLSLF
jgi:release factor glutamine methyltransferase